MMKYKIKWSNNAPAELSVVMQQDVGAAPDYHDGAIESLKREHERLLMWTAAIIDVLTPVQQNEVAGKMGAEVSE